MRRDVLNPGLGSHVVNDLAYLALPPTLSPSSEQKRPLLPIADQNRSASGQPVMDGATGRDTERDDSFLVALSDDPDDAVGKTDILNVNPDQLPDTDSGCIQEFESCPITKMSCFAVLRSGTRRFHEPRCAIHCEDHRECAICSRTGEFARGVTPRAACVRRPFEEPAGACAPSGDSGTRQLALIHLSEPRPQDRQVHLGDVARLLFIDEHDQLLYVRAVCADRVLSQSALSREVHREVVQELTALLGCVRSYLFGDVHGLTVADERSSHKGLRPFR